MTFISLVTLSALAAQWVPRLPMLLIVGASAYLGVEAVLFRKGWLGRRMLTRLWLWWLLALVAVGLIGWQLFLSIRPNLELALQLDEMRRQAQASGGPSGMQLSQTFVVGRLLNDAVAVLALLGLLQLTRMPARWSSFRRFQLDASNYLAVWRRPWSDGVVGREGWRCGVRRGSSTSMSA